jgi:serine/threonine protein phosphatase PrpC
MLNIRIAGQSEMGARQHNEDDLKFGANGELWYAVVADGAGGHEGGAVASDLVVRLLAHRLQAAPWSTPETLTTLVCDTHAALGDRQQGLRGRARMHATVVALWLDSRQQLALWSHVGDSRLYMLRHGRVQHVTQDDSVVQEMVRAGMFTDEQARTHPARNQLISAMGSESPPRPHTLAEPMPLRDGDAFLLCTDGWWEPLDSHAIESTLAVAESPAQWLASMGAMVAEAGHRNQDNYSAVAVWVGDTAQVTRLGEVTL